MGAYVPIDEANPLAVEADNYNYMGNEKSWFSSFGDALTLGAKGATYSAINSFLDTGKTVANWFGSDYQMSDTYTELLDTDPEAAEYYRQNKAGVDLAGFVAGSIIPGTAGLKMFNAARSVGTGSRFSRSMNLFAAPRETATIAAMDAIKAGAPTIDAALRSNKLKAIANGFGENALQSTVWELSVAATMSKSPILESMDLEDIGLNVLTGGLIGGALGGVFDAFGLVGKFNKARAAADLRLRPYEAATSLGKGDFLGGDRIIALIDSLDKIPLPAPSGAASLKAAASYENAQLEARKILVGMSDDAEAANRLFDKLWEMKTTGQATNDDLLDYLGQATKISRIGADANKEVVRLSSLLKEGTIAENSLTGTARGRDYAFDWEVLNPEIPLKTGRFMTKDEFLTATPEQLTGRYANKTSAFKQGEDLFINEQGLIEVNPMSTRLKKTAAAGKSDVQGTQTSVIVELGTGRVTDKAIPALGDIFAKESIELTKIKGGLIIDKQAYRYTAESAVDDVMNADLIRTNGRYVWAALKGVEPASMISVQDFPMMDTLLRTMATGKKADIDMLLEDITIVGANGAKYKAKGIADDLISIVDDAKRAAALDLATRNGMTADEIAFRLNISKDRVQAGMTPSKTLDEVAPDAKRFMQPQHVRVTYDVGNPVKDLDDMVARGMVGVQARITRAKDAASTVFANFTGSFGRLFPEIDPRFSQRYANQEGAGASAFGAANSEYATPGQLYEAVGAGTKQLITELDSAVDDTLATLVRNVAQDPQLAAELGMITNMLRSSAEHYKLVTTEVQSGNDVLRYKYLILEQLADTKAPVFRQTPKGLGFDKAAKDALPEGYVLEVANDLGFVPKQTKTKYAAIRLKNEALQDWFEKNVAINDNRLAKHADWSAAQGINREIKYGRVYAPPIDTRKYKYFAFVKEPAGNGASSSSVATITATNEAELTVLINQAKNKGYDVIVNTKDSIKRFHEARGDYDYNMNLTENTVDSALKREGILSNYFPETDAQRILDDWMGWHRKQNSRLVRNHVELKYAQQFAELRELGRQFTSVATAKFERTGAFAKDTAKNPYEDYIKAALNLSKASEYRLWMDANEKVEAFFDSAFSIAKSVFPKAASGKVSWEEANKAAQKYGLGTPYVNAAAYLEAQNVLPPTPHLRQFIQGMNGVLAATSLRLDFFNSIVNTISTPILLSTEVSALRRRMTQEQAGLLDDALRMTAPGTDVKIPATTKLLYNAIHNYFGPDSAALITKYKQAGVMPDLLQQHRSMLDDLAFHPNEAPGVLRQKLTAAVAKGEKLTGNTFAESFTRFISANVMDQIAKIAGVGDKEALAYVRTFVNRVQGNVLAAQRPVAFQGVMGQAMGLFQTYQFNLLQQMFRHVANGDKKTVATMLGMQSTLFGFQGLPLFGALNTHIIGNAPGNPNHADLFQAIPRVVGKDVGDFLLYGGAANFSGTGIYSRGDINPRQISILPINPLDWPAISGVTRFVSNLSNVAKKMSDGAPFLETMLQGLEHNSLSRPLAGLAQTIQGQTTTSQGSLIARTVETGFIASAARLAGSRPISESIALDAQYRSTAYRAKDTERRKQLGEAIKTAFATGRSPTVEEIQDFASSYAALGGEVSRFNAFMMDAAKNATQSVVNQTASKMNDPIARGMMEIMGGKPLPDYVGFSVGADSGGKGFNQSFQGEE